MKIKSIVLAATIVSALSGCEQKGQQTEDEITPESAPQELVSNDDLNPVAQDFIAVDNVENTPVANNDSGDTASIIGNIENSSPDSAPNSATTTGSVNSAQASVLSGYSGADDIVASNKTEAVSSDVATSTLPEADIPDIVFPEWMEPEVDETEAYGYEVITPSGDTEQTIEQDVFSSASSIAMLNSLSLSRKANSQIILSGSTSTSETNSKALNLINSFKFVQH